jgi:hypothetical protein
MVPGPGQWAGDTAQCAQSRSILDAPLSDWSFCLAPALTELGTDLKGASAEDRIESSFIFVRASRPSSSTV